MRGDHQRFDFVGDHTRHGLVQRKTSEKIVFGSDNNSVIYEYEFELKVFFQAEQAVTQRVKM